MESLFSLFPEEIWDIIIGMLEDSADILKMLKAYPELDVVLKKKRHLWLFEQVFPHVVPWLRDKNILACRGVCRRWSRAVDTFLENHPSIRAFQHGSQVTGQIWVPEASSRYSDLGDYILPIMFSKPEALTKFLREGKVSHPDGNQGRNPFVGRSIDLYPDNDFLMNDLNIKHYWNEASELIRKYGGHIWFLQIRSYDYYHNSLHFCKSVLDCLDHLPNLKCLDLSGQNYEPDSDDSDYDTRFKSSSSQAVDKFVKYRRASLPPLPQLEMFDFDFEYMLPSTLIDVLMSQYSTQIRKLSILTPFWKQEYADLFPNLTALEINDIKSKSELADLLLHLNAPKLIRLRIGLDWIDPFVIETDLLPGLKRFPIINELELWCECSREGGLLEYASIQETGRLSLDVDSIPSLKSLEINDNNNQLYYNFLRCFPSLEYLKISSKRNETITIKSSLQPKVKIRKYIQNQKMFESNVWELLPKLKEVTLFIPSNRSKYFSRARYDFLKKMKLL